MWCHFNWHSRWASPVEKRFSSDLLRWTRCFSRIPNCFERLEVTLSFNSLVGIIVGVTILTAALHQHSELGLCRKNSCFLDDHPQCDNRCFRAAVRLSIDWSLLSIDTKSFKWKIFGLPTSCTALRFTLINRIRIGSVGDHRELAIELTVDSQWHCRINTSLSIQLPLSID